MSGLPKLVGLNEGLPCLIIVNEWIRRGGFENRKIYRFVEETAVQETDSDPLATVLANMALSA